MAQFENFLPYASHRKRKIQFQNRGIKIERLTKFAILWVIGSASFVNYFTLNILHIFAYYTSCALLHLRISHKFIKIRSLITRKHPWTTNELRLRQKDRARIICNEDIACGMYLVPDVCFLIIFLLHATNFSVEFDLKFSFVEREENDSRELQA